METPITNQTLTTQDIVATFGGSAKLVTPKKPLTREAVWFEPGENKKEAPSKETNKTLEAALEYEKHGFSIIPVKTWDKKPYLEWKPFQTHQS